MKTLAIAAALSSALALTLLTSNTAMAQGYYGPQAAPAYAPANGGFYGGNPLLPGGFQNRAGRMTAGVSLGLGGMSAGDQAVRCSNCSQNPAAMVVAGHIGGMVNARLGIMLEVQGNLQTIEQSSYDQTYLTQTALMAAGQYWVTPRLWLKGGLGFAHLSLTSSASDAETPIDDGVALLAGAGYELLSNRNFAVDLQGRFIVGTFDGVDTKTSSATVGIGLNWF